jgi:hypothetical protein
LLIGALMVCGGCAVKQPQTFRLVGKDGNTMIVPPGVASGAVERRTFVTDVPAGKCPDVWPAAVSLDAPGKHPRITVDGTELAKQPGDWLSFWAAQLEAHGCIAPGSWPQLANQVAEAVPMDTRTAFRLVYGEAVDLWPHVRIQVDSPILKEAEADADLTKGPMSVKETPGGLQVQMKSSDNLVGYERAWYGVQPKNGGQGLRIVPLSAERHIGGKTEARPAPAKNYFSFSPETGYYRLIYKQDQTNFTALVVAGRTRSELDANAAKLAGGEATCETAESGFCLAIPKGVGANLFLEVTVNGKEEVVIWGATVRNAIRYPGHRPEDAIPTLSVSQLHSGKPAPVVFDKTGTDILSLRLVGGETISWY